jgi:hypothetical protein
VKGRRTVGVQGIHVDLLPKQRRDSGRIAVFHSIDPLKTASIQ